MAEYVAQARANQAWVALRDGDLARAEQGATEAWRLWQQIPYSGYPVVQWIAVWPLIAVMLTRDRLAEAMELVRGLLDPAHQPMPEDLQSRLESARAAWELGETEAARQSLKEASRLAASYGYL